MCACWDANLSAAEPRHTQANTHTHTHTHTHRSAHASGRGEPSRDDQEGGSSSRPARARRPCGGKGVGGRAGKDSGAAGKDEEDSEFGDDDMPFPLDAAALDQLMPKRGRPVGAKDTKQRKKRMGMSVISLARTYAHKPHTHTHIHAHTLGPPVNDCVGLCMHVTADTYVHDRGNDFINALIAHLHVCLDMCIALGHIGAREGGALGDRVNAPTLTIWSLRPTVSGAPGTSHPPGGEGGHNRGSGRTSADAGGASSVGVSGSGGDTSGGATPSHPHGLHHLQPNLR